MARINLYVDQQSQTLVVSDRNSQPFNLATLFQGNLVPFTLTVLDPTGDFTAPYSKVDCGSLSLRMAIGDTPAGASGQTPLAIQTSWDWDAAQKRFGPNNLALNTADIDTFLGTAAQKTAYFEINLVTGPNQRITLYQGQILIKAVVDELGAYVPVPVTQYYSQEEANNTFARKNGLPGEVFSVTSPSGLWRRTIGVDDTGTRTDVIEQLP